MPALLFGFVEESHVTEVIAEAYATYQRFDDLYNGLTWRLAHDPYPSKAVEVYPGIYTVKTDAPKREGFCNILLVYSVDDESKQITIVDIRIDPLPETEPFSVPD